ncbi:hypothetical protein U27_02675 [Candidatus Vecturithrix granuli]|uniref:DUF362 domain-containing protein n=1 Tax=Vecturithrix granuli TaxID=1499967 RepID=A0A081BTR2_VECG1|nr:hypothetical protein U27_02675 [Candidatus Vecturithrix granuli]
MSLVIVDFESYDVSITQALDLLGAKEVVVQQAAVLIKLNLVNASPHPVTTAVACCEAIVKYVRRCSQAEIVIAEGVGDASLDTPEVFQRLGYTELSKRYGIKLIDLNTAPLRRLENSNCQVFPEIYLPEIAFTHYLISVPVLKAHSLATMTGTLKNMIGFAPPEHYAGRFGSWKKAVFHHKMQQAIIDLNTYRTPDLSIMDASVGLADFHLGGAHCSPPVKKIVAGYNPVEVDREAAKLLGLNWQKIAHLAVNRKA